MTPEEKLILQYITGDPDITNEDKIILAEIKIKYHKKSIKEQNNIIKELKKDVR